MDVVVALPILKLPVTVTVVGERRRRAIVMVGCMYIRRGVSDVCGG
jgi:hypothetical protein